MSPNPRSAAAFGVLGVLICLAGACTDSRSPRAASSTTTGGRPTESSDVMTAPSELVLIEATGGLCAQGLCRDSLLIQSDGSWTRSQGQSHTSGMLDQDQVDQLHGRIEGTDLDSLRARPFHGTCPTATDGQEMTYYFRDQGANEQVASCSFSIPVDNPLISQLNALFETLR